MRGAGEAEVGGPGWEQLEGQSEAGVWDVTVPAIPASEFRVVGWKEAGHTRRSGLDRQQPGEDRQVREESKGADGSQQPVEVGGSRGKLPIPRPHPWAG